MFFKPWLLLLVATLCAFVSSVHITDPAHPPEYEEPLFETLAPETTQEPAKEQPQTDLGAAGSGIVFRPLFAYRYSQQRRRRLTRSTDEEPELTVVAGGDEDAGGKEEEQEDLGTSGSAIVFRPLFAYRYSQSRRRRLTRAVEDAEEPVDVVIGWMEERGKRAIPEEVDGKEVSYTGLFAENGGLNKNLFADLNAQESSLGYKPLFRYKYRYVERRNSGRKQ